LNYFRCKFFEAKYKELNDLINGGEYNVVMEKTPEIKPEKEQENEDEYEEIEITAKSSYEMIKFANRSPNELFSFTIGKHLSRHPDFPLELPNIRKIVIKHFNYSWQTFFESCSFPNIQELWIDYDWEFDIHGSSWLDQSPKYTIPRNIEAILSGMKNLKHLFVESVEDTFNMDIRCNKLETAYFGDRELPGIFLFGSENTLKSLKIGQRILFEKKFIDDPTCLISIYNDFKRLKKLTVQVKSFKNDKVVVPVNNSIKILNIHASTIQALEKILIASPSVKKLILHERMTSHLIHFIGKFD
jgi:hypothetical protein